MSCDNIEYCFLKDDDGHYYLVPLSKKEIFNRTLDKALDTNDHGEFIDLFDEMRIGCSPSLYSFQNPKMIK